MGFVLATFNVQDFFDPTTDDERRRFERRAAHLASIVRASEADVLALQEVGSEATVRALATAIGPDFAAGTAVVGAPDTRGIRNAILTRAKVTRSRTHASADLPFPSFAKGGERMFDVALPLRRALVDVEVDAGSFGRIRVLSCHFKSRRAVFLKDPAETDPTSDGIPPGTLLEWAEADVRSLVFRAAEGLFVRRVVDGIVATDPDVGIAVMGDLNDTVDSVPVACVRGRRARDGASHPAPGVLHGCEDLVPEARRFSIVHGGKRAQIDHVLLSDRLRARVTSAAFSNEDLRDHAEDPASGPALDSDHALYAVRLG
ncbi:MAG: endonuclease/exonuclease/phosphatase family protein [Polyangiaceae bacterium]